VFKITILFNRVWFPPDQANKVGKSFVEYLKENPPDKTIEKNLCIAISSDKEGVILAYGISEVMKGKEKEAIMRNTKQNLFLASKISGLRYKTDIFLDFTEAYKIINMAPPEEV
jgi:hypothetical protein